MAHHRQVMADEQHGDTELPAHLDQQVDDLRLDRDVERRDRLVGNQEARLQDQGTGNADTLALAAGEFVRIAPGILHR